MSETLVIVIRHGETEWNIRGRWQGHDDSPLTRNGHLQAQATAKALKSFSTNALYSSDLGRAVQTAGHIADQTGHTVTKDHRLRERKLGIFQGLTTPLMKNSYPYEYQQFRDGEIDYCVPDGESIRQRYDRSVACLNELASQHPDQSIIIVTHGGVLDGLFRYVTGLCLTAPRNYKIWNCALNIFSFQNDAWQLQTFGDINHLREMRTLDDI